MCVACVCMYVQANRTQLYKSQLLAMQQRFFEGVAKVDGTVGVDGSDTTANQTSTPTHNPFFEAEDGTVVRLSLEQLYGLLSLKHGGKTEGKRPPLAVPPVVSLEAALDATLNSARWAESDTRLHVTELLSKRRTNATLSPVPKSPTRSPRLPAPSPIVSPPNTRNARLMSLPTPLNASGRQLKPLDDSLRGDVSPVIVRSTAELKRFPSPNKVAFRHSGASIDSWLCVCNHVTFFGLEYLRCFVIVFVRFVWPVKRRPCVI